jgi:predicted CoA-binding protein
MPDSLPLRVVVLGASHKPERYANQAVRLLHAKGHAVIPVNPTLDLIEGLPVVRRLGDIAGPVHTLSLYLGPARLEPLIDEILTLAPARVIFNPGTECRPLQQALERAGIPWIAGCTLVMLHTGAF